MKIACVLKLLVVAAIAVTNVSPVFAQADNVAELVSAVEKMASSDAIVFSGTATTPEPKNGGGMGCRMGGVQVIVAGAGQKLKIFSQPFELTVSPEEYDLLICSKKKLPGIAIYQSGVETITSTAFSDEKFSTDDLGNDLPQIFNMKNLKKYIGKVEDCEVEESDGTTSYSCNLSKRFIRNFGNAGPQGMFTASIKRIEAKFQVDGEGEVANISIKVIRENPMAKIMEMGGAMKVEGDMDALSPEMKAQVEARLGGNDIVVQFDLKRESEASSRTKEVMEEMRSLIEQ